MRIPKLAQWFLAILIFTVAAMPACAHPGAGIAVGSTGQVYFVHGGSPRSNRILKIDSAGQLTTFVEGTPGKRLSNPHHLLLDKDENLYCVGDRDSQVLKITPEGKTTVVYPSGDSIEKKVGRGGDPFTIDAQANIYCVEYQQFKQTQILKISPDGKVASLAGGEWGHADGIGSQAKFGDLHGAAFAWAADGTLLTTDNGTFVRRITADGTVSTLAGGEEAGFVNGSGKEARFNGAMGVAVGADGNVYVADTRNRRIRKVTPEGHASTLAGTGDQGGADGPGEKASFDNPAGVAVGRDGAVYVLDHVRSAPRVRKISPAGIVATIATVD